MRDLEARSSLMPDTIEREPLTTWPDSWREIDARDAPVEDGMEHLQAFQRRYLRVLRSIDNGRFHLSISRPNHLPTWIDVRDARYAFLPHELTFAMLLPPPDEYVNVHRNTFHLWEIDDPRPDDAR